MMYKIIILNYLYQNDIIFDAYKMKLLRIYLYDYIWIKINKYNLYDIYELYYMTYYWKTADIIYIMMKIYCESDI